MTKKLSSVIPSKELVQKLKFFNEKHKNPPLASEFPPLQRGIKGDLKVFGLIIFIILTFCTDSKKGLGYRSYSNPYLLFLSSGSGRSFLSFRISFTLSKNFFSNTKYFANCFSVSTSFISVNLLLTAS